MKLEVPAKANRYLDTGLLILRVGLGVMFMFHGAPKLFGGPEKWERVGAAAGNFGLSFAPAFWGFMAGIAEFGGGICLMAGLLFIPANMLLVITMVVAASTHLKAGQGLGGASHAIENGIVFLSLIFNGPGRYTLRSWLGSRKK